jgi:hypothetical protein
MFNRQKIEKEEAIASLKMVGAFTTGGITAQLMIHGVQNGLKATASRVGYTALIAATVSGLGVGTAGRLGIKPSTSTDRSETGLARIGMFAAGAGTIDLLINGNANGFKATANRFALTTLLATSIGSLGMCAFTLAEILKLDHDVQQQAQANKRSFG